MIMKELALKGRAFPTDLNPAGTVFGGWIMSKMDKAASIAVEDIVLSSAVTVSVSDLHFLKPIRNGDIFSIYTEVIAIGKSSLKIKVNVQVTSKVTREEKHVTDGIFTFVTIDNENNPINVRTVIRESVSDDIKRLLNQ